MKIIKTKSFETAVNIIGDENSSKIAILMPGRLDSKDYANFISHAEYLSKYGFLVVSVDPPGTWDSPGSLDNYSTSTYIKDINEIIDKFGNKPTLLLGHSRGGATAMLVSSNPAVSWLVLVNSTYGQPTPPKPEEIKNGLLTEYRDLPPGKVRTDEKKRFDLPMTYFEDATKHDPLSALQNFKGPKLVVHTTRDEFTRLEKVKSIYDGLQEPKTFLQIDCTHDYRLFPEAIISVNEALGQFLSKS
jgi:pimeloyl-ACP methyl ester carboxylesterase